MNRRGFLTGAIASLITAPAIVRSTSIMPVRALKPDMLDLLAQRIAATEQAFAQNLANSLYGGLTDVTRKAFVPRLYVNLYTESPSLRMAHVKLFPK